MSSKNVMTRAQTRQQLAMKGNNVSNSEIHSEIPAPASPSTVLQTRLGVTPMIPATGSYVLDHGVECQPPSVNNQEETQPTASLIRKASSLGPQSLTGGSRHHCRSSHTSRSSRELRRLQAELEAEQQLAEVKENVIKKKLAVNLALIEAEEEESADDLQTVASPERIGEWVNSTITAALPKEQLPAYNNDITHTQSQSYHAPAVTGFVPAESPPYNEPTMRMSHEKVEDCHNSTTTRDQSGGRSFDTGIKQLAECILQMSRPRPMPKQSYELPAFNGNPSDWLNFKKNYEKSSTAFKFKPHENMARLQAALHGEAKTATQDLLRTSDDPEEIIRALEQEYGHPGLLLEIAIQKVRALSKLSDNGREIRKFATTVRNCVATLKNLKATSYLHNPQLVNELVSKLSPIQRTQYGEYAKQLEQQSGIDLRLSPNLEIFLEFINEVACASSFSMPLNLMAAPSTSVTSVPLKTIKGIVQRVHTTKEERATEIKKECVQCKGDHVLPECREFLNMSVDERWEVVKREKLCFKCAAKTHARFRCRAKRCEKCNYAHHTLLHFTKKGNEAAIEKANEEISTKAKVHVERVTNIGELHSSALLKILPVSVVIGDKEQLTFALLDDGATVSLIDKKLVNGVNGDIVPLKVMSAKGLCFEDNTSRRVSIGIRGPNGKLHNVSVRTLCDIDLPTQTIPPSIMKDNHHLRDLDCRKMENARPMVLLGQDNWELIVGWNFRRGKSGSPVASHTKLGWVVHGPNSICATHETVNCLRIDNDLHEMVKQQFEFESIGISTLDRKNKDSNRALEILESTSHRVVSGWEIGLLWNHENVDLPDNYQYAFKRLVSVEKKMDKDPDYAAAYSLQVDRLLSEGYAKKINNPVAFNPVWYLPHFGVINPNKPGKLRLVYDAAATFKGTCLNDNLLCGPDMLNSLLSILLKFRVGPVAFAGDIADMFLRVKIREQDQGAQLFLWRGKDRIREPNVYAMTSMIFGAVSSPTSAIYVLNKNASEYKNSYPEAVAAIKDKHYMDDYLDSVSTVEQAVQLVDDVSRIHSAGGFVIRGWVTNSPELRKHLCASTPERVKMEKSPNEGERILGMIWTPFDDNLAFDLSFKRLPSEIVKGKVIPTKREFMRAIMSVFDPLGFLYPCIIQSRILMQRVWKSGVHWDEQLQVTEAVQWFQWLHNLGQLTDVKISRWYGIISDDIELHVFGDASELAYAAVAFIVGSNKDGTRNVSMVAGKARVAPVKVVSIPRLELQAAVLACRLACTIEKDLGITIGRKIFWTDSQTVLRWINSNARDYQKFVSHRLGEIDSLSSTSDWRWLPTSENPADEATRLEWPNTKNMWLLGPSFLSDLQAQCPRWTAPATETLEDDPERLTRVYVMTEPAPPLIDTQRFSSWYRALRVTARVLAFINRCCCRRRSTKLSADDLDVAEHYLLQESQEHSFAAEIRVLREGRQLPKSSRLKALDPMLYEDGMLRVRGRLRAAPEISFGERHPVILDGRHPTVRLMIFAYHVRGHHVNHEAVINNVRERFWVLHLRPSTKKVISECQLCRIRRAQPSTPKMGDLPEVRLTDTRRAFVHCGIDYFGPMEVAIGRRREKRWGVLVTCLATRAVHLDLVSSLSADSTILALRRLIARRGQVSIMYSDGGTNFVAANTELRAALREFDHNRLEEEATARGIKWVFSPPAAPHMGGSWERLVRTTKNALRVILKERVPREETLITLLAEVELVVNSRPLTYVTDDPDNPVVITPNHLLIGTSAGGAPMCRAQPKDFDVRTQWRRVNAMADEFWRRWRREYLPTLQRRQKWTTNVQNPEVGEVCVIADKNRHRNDWPIGKIVKVYCGKDGIVRVVDIKMKNGILRRPLTNVIILPTK